MDQPPGNIPEYTVTEVSGAVKRTLEGAFGRVRVRGEVTEVRRYPSGHIYFALKDEGGKLLAIAWKYVVPRLTLPPENGVEVVAIGRITAYGDRSSYQLIIEQLEYAGAGALLQRIELLRQKLLAEGLFEAARKQELPRLPEIIGVVTSPQGAVIQDIRTTIARRFPRRILIWPVPVQGEGAAEKIAAAIAGFDALSVGGPVPRPDVLIVARGGGSLEDLMAFNDEAVVRAAAACTIPLISAVGHETDHTLIDLASDRRAPTPTAAAELAVPVRSELLADLQNKAARISQSYAYLAQGARMRLKDLAGQLPDLPQLLEAGRQRLDDRFLRLGLALPALVQRRHTALAQAAGRLPDPRALLAAPRQRLAALSPAAALRQAMQLRRGNAARILSRLTPAPLLAAGRERRTRLAGLAALLESLSPEQVLRRGYALVLRPSGKLVPSASAVTPGAALRLRFADAEVAVHADKPVADKPPRQPKLDL